MIRHFGTIQKQFSSPESSIGRQTATDGPNPPSGDSSLKKCFLPRSLGHFVVVCLVASLLGGHVFADGEGQADLDEATKLKLRSKTADDLVKVADLCESAIDAGLSEEAEEYARSLWVSCLYERAYAMSRPVLETRPIHPRWRSIRRLVLAELEKAIEVDENVGDVHLLAAQLEALPGGDRTNAFESASQAVELFGEEPQKLAQAYVLRGAYQNDIEKSIADFDAAVKADPRNQDGWRVKAVTHLQKGEMEKAIEAFQTLLKLNPSDVLGNQTLANVLNQQGNSEKALELLNNAIESKATTPEIFMLKAGILEKSKQLKDTIDTLMNGVAAHKGDARIRLYLAEAQLRNGDVDLAQEQLDTILTDAREAEFRDQARILRSIVFSLKSQFDEAIRDIRTVLKRVRADDSRRPELLMYLTRYYTSAERPSKAIETASEVLELNEKAWEAYRWRGDAFLSQGKHKQAVQDYEAAQQINETDSGILNNLAWVLATSPDDEVRDGKRAVDVATKACEVTEYKQAHILSTLAAAFAEIGDFDKAVEWSTKAVEADPQEEQLANELASYKQKKPWRELQQVKEKESVNEDENFDDLRIAE